MARRNGGFVGQDGLDAPDPPTGVAGTASGGQVSVAFTAPSDAGTSAITGFVVQVSTDDTAYSAGSNTGTSSPIVVSSLTNGTAATAKVWAINAYGTSAPSDASASFTPFASLGIVFGGDDASSATNIIEYFTITTTGNATDWGDLLATGESFTGGGNNIRGICVGGGNNVIQFIVYATEGNATDFGDMARAVGYAGGTSSASNTTRAVFVSHNFGSGLDTLDYITIASAGNSTDFGDMSRTKHQLCGMASSAGRGVFAGGRVSSYYDDIEYITIASTGNVTDFGNLSAVRAKLAACSSATRGVIAGGIASGSGAKLNTMEYITMGSTGNTTDFGDLATGRINNIAFSSNLRGCIGGGEGSSAKLDSVEYITIATTGNAADFGDLSTVRSQSGSTSNVHGGLQ